MCDCDAAPVGADVSRRNLLRSGLAIGGGALAATALAAAPAGAAGPAHGSSGQHPAPSPGPRRGTELVLLGTRAGPPIQVDRFGTASALVVDGVTYLVDCGRGAASQYVRCGLTMKSLRAMFITHLHADHVADYYNLFMLGSSAANTVGDVLNQPVDIYGPGPAGGLPPAFGGGTAPTIAPDNPTPGLRDLTDACNRAFAYSDNLFMRDSGSPDIRTLMRVHEIEVPRVGASPQGPTAPPMRPFRVMEDDRVKVTAILVPHGPVFPSFAFRFDTDHGSVTFSGDTMYSDNVVTIARDSDLLVHEAINLQGAALPPALYNHMLESHVEVQRVGEIAQRSGVPRLVLSHIGDLTTPGIDAPTWRRYAQQGYHGQVTVGDDLQRFSLAGSRH